VDEWMDKNVRIAKLFASSEDMIYMDRRLQEPLLTTIRKLNPWIHHSATIDLDGNVVAGQDPTQSDNPSESQFYEAVVGGKSIAWQTLTEKGTGRPVLKLAVPIQNSGKTVGFLINSIGLEELSSRIVTWEGADTGFAFLVDERGNVLAHKNAAFVRQRKNLRGHPLVIAFNRGERGSVSFTDERGESILGHVRETAFGWIVAIQQEEREAYDIVDQLKSYAYLFLVVTIVIVFLLAWFTGRALARPIIKLTEAADRISIGDLDVEIDTQRKDEIGDLAEAVALMQDSIRLSIERLRQKR
jgi:methyl-accepting chemotaxis protein